MSALASRLREIHAPRAWAAVGIVGVVVALLPFMGLPAHLVPLFGKFLCYGMAALAMDLVWGYAGILSLGHALFFALGGYGMGMYLMRSIAGEGVYRSKLPDFMVFLDWKELPWFWRGFDNFGFALLCVLLVPGIVAYVFGYFAFRSRIRGACFSRITQPLARALAVTSLLGRVLVTAKISCILRATRTAESRLMFSGYVPKRYKLFVWTL